MLVDRLRECFYPAAGPRNRPSARISVRAAIGASRIRIVRQLLTRSPRALARRRGAGRAAGLPAACLIVAWLPEFSFPHEAAIQINLPVLFSASDWRLRPAFCSDSLRPCTSRVRTLPGTAAFTRRKLTAGVRGKRLHGSWWPDRVALTLVLLLTAAGAAINGFLHLMHATLATIRTTPCRSAFRSTTTLI